MKSIMTLQAPENWPIQKLGQVFEERKEKVSDKDFPPLSVTKNGIVPQMSHVAKSDDSDNRKRVCKGDFVINSRSDRKGSSGISEYDGSVSLISIVIEPRHGHSKFLHYLLKSQAFQEEFYRFGHGIVADLWTTRFSEMKSIPLAIPDYETQKTIAEFLDKETVIIDDLIKRKEKLINLLDIRMDSKVNECFESLPTQRRLKNIANVQLSNVDKHIFENEIQVTACHYTDVYYNDIITKETELRKGSVTPLEYKRFILTGGEVIITKDSESTDDIGIPAFVQSTKENTVCGYHLSIITAFPMLAGGGFIFWALKTKHVRDYFMLNAQGVTRYGLPLGKISDCPIPYTPDIQEQKNISDQLFSLRKIQLDTSEKIEASIQRLKEIKTSLITEAVTGQLDIEAWKNRNTVDRRLDKIEEEMAS